MAQRYNGIFKSLKMLELNQFLFSGCQVVNEDIYLGIYAAGSDKAGF